MRHRRRNLSTTERSHEARDKLILVLNRSYIPVGARPLRKALKKLVTSYADSNAPKAVILDPETYETFSWADWSALKKAAPEIIVLTRYADTPQHKIPFSRRAIYKRDHFTCQYCGDQPGLAELTIDHVIPKSRHGGVSSWENCVLACVSCNSKKANRTPSEAGLRLRHKPKRPNFIPLLGGRDAHPQSWAKFISNSYWDCQLDQSW